MRNIIFRGFHPDEKGEEKVFVNGEWIYGKWVYGYYVIAEFLNKKGHEYFIIEEKADGKQYNVIPETVGQYTGVKDKNGKRIFEGDISKDKLVVTYIPQKASFCLAKRGWLFAHFFDEAIKVENGVAEIEIIGNIHDTPELLEKPS